MERVSYYWMASLLLFVSVVHAMATYSNCDESSIQDNVKVSKLTPNTFHKICPGTHGYQSFGQPQCGDGTAFSFYFSRPPHKKLNDRKILIEFQGGGACWDAETCNMQSSYLTFPSQFDNFVGLSCSEISAGIEMTDAGGSNFLINILCAKQVGDVDFTEYNSIVVPYCTQDVHVGDSFMEYEEGSVIAHKGAHNMVSTLRWIFKNFPNPSHIALTGCSAGGTALPIAYDLLNMNYNSVLKAGMRSVQIGVISDSPVYLTPSYFLENALDNWNPSNILHRIRFNYNKYRQSEEYPTQIWDHVLKRGSNKDRWGLVTHTDDPVSLIYYQWMSGGGDGGDGGNGGGEDGNDGGGDNDGDSSQWWSELMTSVSTIQKKHRNVDLFTIESEGHCSFGLYYPMQEEGFEEWAGSIYHEDRIAGRARRSALLFSHAFLLGYGVAAGIYYAGKQRKPVELDDVVLLNDDMKVNPRPWIQAIVSFLARFKAYPLTSGYFVAITFYFVSMLIASGFAHPINNPSLGPNAEALSVFGINNPTLIVYEFQIWRLITSNFLCSGILTYLIVTTCLWRNVRHIEEETKNTIHFSVVAFSVLMGSNLFYAGLVDGASCASVSLVLGLQSFSIAMGKKLNSEQYEVFPTPWTSTIGFFILTCIFFPFNSWVMLLSAMAIGGIIAPLFFDTNVELEDNATTNMRLRRLSVMTLGCVYLIMFFLLLFRVRKPNEIYKYPYLTGCELIYTTEVNSIIQNYYNGDENGRRLDEVEENGDEADMCAQLCIPHIAYRPVYWGVNEFVGFSIQHGMCEENGYDQHVADKTFSFMSYSIDVEIYYENGYGQDERR